MDAEVEKIKADRFAFLKYQRVVMIVADEDGLHVEQWSPDSVAPTSTYYTPQEAAARVCQLLGLTKPVMPQVWPEIAQIGDGGGTPPLSS